MAFFTKGIHINRVEGLSENNYEYKELNTTPNSGDKNLTLRQQVNDANNVDNYFKDITLAKTHCNNQNSCLGYVLYDPRSNNTNAIFSETGTQAKTQPLVGILNKRYLLNPGDKNIVETPFPDKMYLKIGLKTIILILMV